ncbi:hypothetical protein Tco_1153652 [Tanacetum coccineum]
MVVVVVVVVASCLVVGCLVVELCLVVMVLATELEVLFVVLLVGLFVVWLFVVYACGVGLWFCGLLMVFVKGRRLFVGKKAKCNGGAEVKDTDILIDCKGTRGKDRRPWHDTSVECFVYYKTQGHVTTGFELHCTGGDQSPLTAKMGMIFSSVRAKAEAAGTGKGY